MQIVLTIAWLAAVIALIDGFLLSGRDSLIYLGLNLVAGILFIAAGFFQVPMQLFGYAFSPLVFGMAWIAISVVEVYSMQIKTENTEDEDRDNDE